MLQPFHRSDLRGWQILEPSAGSGAILDYLTQTVNCKRNNIYAIEADQELAFNLQGKDYRLIHNDFLSYSGEYLFDLIIMNPPFSNGDQHLLRAWEILNEGHIVCLLNAETIRNTNTERRKLLAKIIEQHGSVEYLGSVFSNAARKTDVNIALVRLKKTDTSGRFSFDFKGTDREATADFSEEIAGNDMAMNDITGAMLRQYEMTKGAYVDYIKAKKALLFYSQGLTAERTNITEIADKSYSSELNQSYNDFVSELKASAWMRILTKLNIEKYITNGVRENFNKFRKQQGAMDLTRENIRALVGLIINNRGEIMNQAVVDVFDTFTKFHEYNRCHIEGWKTNDAWRVNRKVILPWYIEGSWSHEYRINHSRWDEFNDIDKVMCWLTGKQLENIQTLKDSIHRVKIGDSSLHSSEFFDFRCYKKGTLHITFRDKDLWAKFNQEACKGKNWLPGL